LFHLKILPPRSFQFTGGASQHRLFFFARLQKQSL